MPRSDAPPWLRAGSMVLCLAGLVISVYLTIDHFSASSVLACPDSGAINCVAVTQSTYAWVFGVPVAPLGLAYFLVMTAWCSPPAWRAGSAIVRQGRVLAAGAGVVGVVYLVWAELFGVGLICLWCTFVHVISVALFALVAVGTALWMPPAPQGD